MGIMNLSTYGYTVLAAHTIGKEAYGAFSALMGALLVISVLSLGLQATGARRISAAPDQVDRDRARRARGRAAQRAGPGRGLPGCSPRCSTPCCISTASRPRCWSASRRSRSRYMGAQAGVLQGERRWAPLALVYLAQGVGRLGFGLVLILIWPTEFAAMAGVALGCWLPVLVGWLALRRPRADVPHSEGHPGLDLLREVGHSSQALLAFFALSNADILVARATMSNSQAGLYAAGLIMAKAVLFLPQFVVVYAFPSMSKEETNRRTLLLALGLSASARRLRRARRAGAAGPRPALRRRRGLRSRSRTTSGSSRSSAPCCR